MRARRQPGVWAATIAVAALAGVPAAASGGDVRPLQARGDRLLAEGLRASPSLAALVAELRASDVVVYVDLDPEEPGPYSGALRFRGAAAGVRYLHVWLACRRVDAAIIATLAHELYHAAEVARVPTVGSAEAFTAFYRSIGRLQRPGCYETDAAQATTARVRRELEQAAARRQ